MGAQHAMNLIYTLQRAAAHPELLFIVLYLLYRFFAAALCRYLYSVKNGKIPNTGCRVGLLNFHLQLLIT